MKDLTIIIKTLDRYDCLKKLLKSIRKYYPNIKVLIGDDSEISCDSKIKSEFGDMNIEVYNLPSDCGASYGRNYLVNKVKTKYFCLCDDDFEIDKKTNLEEALKILKKNKLDILGGYVRNYKIISSKKDYLIRIVQKILRYELPTNYIGTIEKKENTLNLNYFIHSFPDYQETDIAVQFFIANTLSIKNSPWSDELKIQEHTPFFYNAKKNGLKTAFTNKLSIRHCPVQSKNYKLIRFRNYTHVFMDNNNIDKIVATYDDSSRNTITTAEKLDNIFISIIVPVYNVEGRIDKLIKSLKEQSYKNFEVLLVDNNSKDNSIKYIKTLINKDKRFHLLEEKNQGPNYARKKGFDNSKGDYIYFCDADDYLEDDTLYRFCLTITKHNCDVVIGDYIEKTVNNSSTRYMKGIYQDYSGELKNYKDILLIKPAIWNKIFKRTLLDDNSFIFTFIFEDALITLLALMKAKSIRYIGEPVYNYILDDNGLTSTLKYDRLVNLIDSQDQMKEKFIKAKVYKKYKEELDYVLLTHTIYRMFRIVMLKDKNEQKDAYDKFIVHLRKIDKNNKYLNSSIAYKVSYVIVNNKILFAMSKPFIKLLFTNKTINKLFKKLDK